MKRVVLVLLCITVLALGSEVQPHLEKASCDKCLTVMKAVQSVATNATKMTEVVEALQTKCHTMGLEPSLEKLCDSMASLVGKVLPLAFKGLDELAWDIPMGVCAIFEYCSVPCCDEQQPRRPEQIHLSLTTDESEMVVSWVTLLPADNPVVTWRRDGSAPPSVAAAEISTYTVGGWKGTIYKAVMTGLKSNTRYHYSVGSPQDGYSDWFGFRSLPARANYSCTARKAGMKTPPIRIAWLGDMSYDNCSDGVVKHLTDAVLRNEVDVVIHVGDISYADGFERHNDMFMRKIQPIAARVPYMVSPGNHEFWQNFTAYKSRFFMPGQQSGSNTNMYYSHVIGPLSIIAYNTETVIDTCDIDSVQKTWLSNALAAADHNRDQQPWILTHGHRPMYCSNNRQTDCVKCPQWLQSKIEDLFMQYKVDLVMNGHEHNYERLWPTYKNIPVQKDYVDAKAPAYIVNGAGGNREGHRDNWKNPIPDNSAVRLGEWGFLLMTWNDGSLKYNFFNDDGTVRDSFTMTKKSQC